MIFSKSFFQNTSNFVDSRPTSRHSLCFVCKSERLLYGVYKQNRKRITEWHTGLLLLYTTYLFMRDVPFGSESSPNNIILFYVYIKAVLTAIKLLLTDPLPLLAVLKCSITSQLDFFGVVVCGAASGDANGCTCSSNDIWADLVWRNDVERRVMPPPFRELPSWHKENRRKKKGKKNYFSNNNLWTYITPESETKLMSHSKWMATNKRPIINGGWFSMGRFEFFCPSTFFCLLLCLCLITAPVTWLPVAEHKTA